MGQRQSREGGVPVTQDGLCHGEKPGGALRFVCISDTHDLHTEITEEGSSIALPPGDVLLHSGDFTYYGTCGDVEHFVRWFAQQPHKHKIFIAGNHDIGLEPPEERGGRYVGMGEKWKKGGEGNDSNEPTQVRERMFNLLKELEAEGCKIHYLEDSSVELEGIKVYGSPWSPAIVLPWFARLCITVGRMAFNLMTPADQEAKWAEIPPDADVVVTHSPPFGICDRTFFGSHVGDVKLRERVLRDVRPQFHVFGHVHEGRGVETFQHPDGSRTAFINAAVCDTSHPYKAVQGPWFFDVAPRRQ